MNILDLFLIADKEHIPVDFIRMGYARSVSIQDKDRKCYIGLDLTTFEGSVDMKMNFAHELGHCLKGGFYTKKDDAIQRKKAEAKADAWAFEHLLPKEKLIPRIREIDSNIPDIADHFGVSVDFLQAAIEHYARKEA